MRTNEKENVKEVIKDKDKRLDGKDISFIHLDKTLGSKYEEFVKKLALESWAKRAAQPKFLKKASIIMFSKDKPIGFRIYENNKKDSKFYLWQMAIVKEFRGLGLSKVMIDESVKNNTNNYPICVSIHKDNIVNLENYKSMGFKPYQQKGKVIYLCKGGIVDGVELKTSDLARIKEIVGMLPTNIWNSATGNWSVQKAKWNELINQAGINSKVENPAFATRENCWNNGGLSKLITGKSHNEGASVLDPFVCEILIKLFLPKGCNKIYNPFAGGVQMGFVSGFFNCEYLGTEIRKNQCDANNKICNAFQMKKVKWINADSSSYKPKNKYDLIFACPPYYKVEKYTDYNNKIPEGELNNMDTYEQFKDNLFKGYLNAIDCLNNNRFFVIMVGDSRDKEGAYYGAEAETELFLKDAGLHIYNRVVYQEPVFTRGFQISKMIQSRKFPKIEQKIIFAYKGNIKNIRTLFEKF